MLYTLKDAIEQHQYQTEGAHKLWNYFQVVAVGSAAIAWQLPIPQPLIISLLAAFIFFSAASNYAIYSSQRQSWDISLAIKEYCTNNPSEIPKEFIETLKSIKSFNSYLVSAWHGLLSIATIAAIGAKAFNFV
jgi:hypothetical protein